MAQAQATVRERLVEAALDMLERSGAEALQARPLTAEVGTSTMAIYTHFGGMSELLAALTREGFAQFGAALGAIEAGPDPIADLVAMGLVYRDFALRWPQLYRLMFGLTTPATGQRDQHDLPESAAAFDHLRRVMERAIQSGRIDAGDPTALARQIWSLTHGYVLLDITGVFGECSQGLGEVLRPLMTTVLIGLGDTPERIERSMTAGIEYAMSRAPS